MLSIFRRHGRYKSGAEEKRRLRPLNGLRAWRWGGVPAGVAVGKLPADATARAAVTVEAAKKSNPQFRLGRGNPDATPAPAHERGDGNLTRRQGLVLSRKRSIATPATAGVQRLFSSPPPKTCYTPSTNHSFASINATVIYFYTNFQPPPERTNDQSSQDDARPQRRVHRIESVESIHVESNCRIESVESICVEIVRAESICAESNRVESIEIIRVESSRIESNRAEIIRVESVCIESIEIIRAESSRIEIICAEIIHKKLQIKRALKQSQTPTQHRKRRALCRD